MRYFVLAVFFFLNSAFSQTQSLNDKQKKLRELEKLYSEVSLDTLSDSKEFALEAFEISKSLSDTVSQIKAALYIGETEVTEFNFDSSFTYLKKALSLSRELKDTLFIIRSLTGLGYHFFLKPNYTKALDYLKQSEKLLKTTADYYETTIQTYFYLARTYDKLGDKEASLKYSGKVIEEIKEPSIYLAKIYAHISIIYRDDGDIRRAMKYLMKAIELSEKLGNWEVTSRNYILLSGFTERSGRSKDAMKYYDKAIAAAKKSNHPRAIGYVYMNIGSDNFTNGNIKKAMEYNKIALSYFEKINDLHYMAFTCNNIGQVFLKVGNLDSAKFYINKGLQYGIESNNRISIGLSYKALGKIAFQKNDYERAIYNFQKGLEDYYIANVAESYGQLSEAYAKIDKPDSALYYMKLHNTVKDSMFKISAQQFVIDAEIKYDVDQKVKELEVARADKKKLEEKFTISRNFTLIFIFVGLIILGFVVYYYRNKTIEFIQKINPHYKKGNSDRRRLKNVIKAIDEVSNGQSSPKHLDDKLVNEIISRLDKVMTDEKLFRNPKITQSKVAAKIETNTSYLSRAINQKYNLNFSSYVNTFRVKEAEKIIAEDKNEVYTFEGISQSVGFTSKSAFYNAFKRFNGKTPSQYAKDARN